MQPSDDLAHEILELTIDAGGTWDVGLSSTVPVLTAGTYTGVTDVTEITHGTLTRATAAWATPSGRSVIPLADVSLGTASDDCTAVAWILYDGTDVVWASRIADLNIAAGSTVTLPKEAIRLTIP